MARIRYIRYPSAADFANSISNEGHLLYLRHWEEILAETLAA